MLLCSFCVNGQITFQKVYFLEGQFAFPYDLVQTSDKGFMITGYIQDLSGNKDILMIRTDSLGEIKWQKQYGGSATEIAQSSLEDQYGNIYVVGYSYENVSSDIICIKLDSSGNTVWTKVWGDFESDHGWDILQTKDSTNFIISGYGYSAQTSSYTSLLMKINSDGDTLFTKTYGGEYNDYGHSIKHYNDGYIICGHTSSFSDTTLGFQNHDAYIYEVDSNFNMIWSNAYGFEGREEGNAVAVTQENDLVFVGVTNAFGNDNDMFVVKIDSTGDTLWSRIIGTPYDDDAFDVIINDENEIIISGYATNPSSRGMAVIKLDQMGETIFTKVINNGNTNEGLYGITKTADNGFAICGYTYSYGPTLCKIFVAKYDSTMNSNCIDSSTVLFNLPEPLRIGPGVESPSFVLTDKVDSLNVVDVVLEANEVCGFAHIESQTTMGHFQVYPNPIGESFIVQASEVGNDLRIIDALGKIHYHHKMNSEIVVINSADFPAGIYFVVLSNSKINRVEKVVKF